MYALALVGFVVGAGTAAPVRARPTQTMIYDEQHAAGTCDFRLAESTRYSQWTAVLGNLGVSANTTVNINGEFLGSGELRGIAS